MTRYDLAYFISVAIAASTGIAAILSLSFTVLAISLIALGSSLGFAVALILSATDA